ASATQKNCAPGGTVAGETPALPANLLTLVGQSARKSAIIRGSCKAIRLHRSCFRSNSGVELRTRAGLAGALLRYLIDRKESHNRGTIADLNYQPANRLLSSIAYQKETYQQPGQRCRFYDRHARASHSPNRRDIRRRFGSPRSFRGTRFRSACGW